MNLVLTINNRRTHTNTVDYLKKCICMYLHTGVKRVCTKMSHRLTITKKKHFPFLQLQVLKKNYVQKKGHGDEIGHWKQLYSHTMS